MNVSNFVLWTFYIKNFTELQGCGICIRPSSNMASSAGRLDFLFFLPEANDARNNLKLVDIEDMEKKDVVRGFHPMAVMKMLQS